MSFTNRLVTDKHVFVCIPADFDHAPACPNLIALKTNFCGRVVTSLDVYRQLTVEPGTMVFLSGDVNRLLSENENLKNLPPQQLVAIQEYSRNNNDTIKEIRLGQVPINVHGVGVFIREGLDAETPYFEQIAHEHQFQALTESNKPGVAYRTGAYITRVDEEEEAAAVAEEEKQQAASASASASASVASTTASVVSASTTISKFHLLRCSSNFKGPTNNVQPTDQRLLETVNELAKQHFSKATDLNHILAQIYHNSNEGGRDRKAVISRHSDKTKDMPVDGLMAFCTFYKDYTGRTFPSLVDQQVKRSNKDDPFDFRYHEATVLTTLRFKPKPEAAAGAHLVPFDVLLYPNSIFLMPLEMNRLFTHEIVPSNLPIAKLPTRMGYVIRCSKTRAVHMNGKTYLNNPTDDTLVELQNATHDEMVRIKQLYAAENLTTQFVDYGFIPFTMNNGDLMKPIV